MKICKNNQIIILRVGAQFFISYKILLFVMSSSFKVLLGSLIIWLFLPVGKIKELRNLYVLIGYPTRQDGPALPT